MSETLFDALTAQEIAAIRQEAIRQGLHYCCEADADYVAAYAARIVRFVETGE